VRSKLARERSLERIQCDAVEDAIRERFIRKLILEDDLKNALERRPENQRLGLSMDPIVYARTEISQLGRQLKLLEAEYLRLVKHLDCQSH
jgi:hypothetical protein